MTADKKLTLAEMAHAYSRCTKTFRKYVLALGIPHAKLGRDMLFDPVRVDEFLLGLTHRGDRPKDTVSSRKKSMSPTDRGQSEFAGILG